MSMRFIASAACALLLLLLLPAGSVSEAAPGSSASPDPATGSGSPLSSSLREFSLRVREQNRPEAFSFDAYDNSERARQWRYNSSDAELTESDISELLDLPNVLKKGDTFVVLFYARWDHFSQRVIPVYRAAAEMFEPRANGSRPHPDDGAGTHVLPLSGNASSWLPFFSLDAAKFPGHNSRFGVYAFPRIFVCNVTGVAAPSDGSDWLSQRPTIHWRSFNTNDDKARTVDNATGINTIDLAIFAGFVSEATGINASRKAEDVRIRLPPLGRPTPEADIYVYLSGSMCVFLFVYAIFVACKVSGGRQDRTKIE